MMTSAEHIAKFIVSAIVGTPARSERDVVLHSGRNSRGHRGTNRLWEIDANSSKMRQSAATYTRRKHRGRDKARQVIIFPHLFC